MPDDGAAVQLPENSRIVHPDYLNKGLNSNKNDLIRRLRNLVNILRTDEVETESPEWPGLASVAQLLMTNDLLNHRDQEVRLFTVLASVEILTLYAPDVPWDEGQIINLFQQMTRHLGNLAVTTGERKSDMFQHYAHILQYTADYKLGCLLVDMDKDENESARETQIDFFHTLLGCLHHEHPTELIAQVRDAIVATLEEYDGVAIPIPLIDELLKCIGQGPTVTIVDPKAGPKRSKRNGKLPERQVKNPSFIAASGIIQQLMNRLALPISQLLNGLLQREPYYVGKSTIQCIVENGDSVNEVHQIIYHLHRVAPQVLTTVMGTISNDLTSVDGDQRLMVVNLLGRLFAVDKTANLYAACFREWLRRSVDVEVPVRMAMVDHCMVIIKSSTGEPVQLAAETLRNLVRDPSSVEVRSTAVRVITENVFQSKEELPFLGDLLQVVGDRVSSKQKSERQDAITGLAHVYNKRFLVPKLQAIVDKGEDCDLELILATLRNHRSSRHGDDQGVYEWIPSKVFKCLHFTDEMDIEMRSKVVHLIDSVLLKGLTPTAAAVAWAIIFDSLDDKDRAFLTRMFKQRAFLQKELASYIEKRSYCRDLEKGSEEAITAESQAFEQLEAVSRATVPAEGPDPEIVLKKFHTAKDKRIFHLLSSITNAQDSKTARNRALEELPPRTRPLGDETSNWIQNLVKRSAMGESLNAEIIENCVILAQECLKEEEVSACKAFLQTVELAVHVFPDICNTGETRQTLAELLSSCGNASSELRKSLKSHHIVTLLSSIMSSATTSPIPDGQNISYENDALKTELTNLCTRDGTPDQAYNAVHSLAKLLNPNSSWGQDGCDNLSELFQALTSASRLRLGEESSSNCTLVTILSSLSAVAECSPLSFSTSRGARAIKFALDVVLLGRNHEGADSEDEGSQHEHDATTPTSDRRRKSVSSSRKAATPEKTSVLEDVALSLACKRLCASIQFLVSYVRFSCFANEWNKKKSPSSSSDLIEIKKDINATLFQTLTQILIDQGLPPSNRDRSSCKSRRERAALRQVSAVSLLRLCDPRAGIEKNCLTSTMWHVLGGAFLDEENAVREAIFTEYSDMLKGEGAYGSSIARLQPSIASLRFLSFVCLTSDGDHDHDAANGSAANVGSLVSTVQNAATRLIVGSRKASEACYAQCKALGKDSLKRYESGVKMKLMPENVVPFAVHLLSHRRETPAETIETGEDPPGFEPDEDSSSGPKSDEQHRVLQRRLRLLLDPLIESLGEYADNISYLIRVTEMLKVHQPIDVSLQYSAASQQGRFALRSPSNQAEDVAGPGKMARSNLLNARQVIICSAAREILLTYIKQDVNLTPYPGQVSFPLGLFRKSASGVVIVKKSSASVTSGRNSKPTKKRSSPMLSTPGKAVSVDETMDSRPTASAGFGSSGKSSRVHFSPEVKKGPRLAKKTPSVSPKGSANSLTSPATLASTSSNAAATLGASPPPSSIVPTSTALDDDSDNEEVQEVVSRVKATSQSASVSQSLDDSRSSRSSSRRRKQPERLNPSPEVEQEEMPKKKKQKKSPPPKQIHLKNDLSRSTLGSSSSKVSKGSLPKFIRNNRADSDDLDFPPGQENQPKPRTSSNRAKKARTAKKG